MREWLSGASIDKIFCCVYSEITEHEPAPAPDKKPAGVAKQVHVCSLKARHSSSSIPSSLPYFFSLVLLLPPPPWPAHGHGLLPFYLHVHVDRNRIQNSEEPENSVDEGETQEEVKVSLQEETGRQSRSTRLKEHGHNLETMPSNPARDDERLSWTRAWSHEAKVMFLFWNVRK